MDTQRPGCCVSAFVVAMKLELTSRSENDVNSHRDLEAERVIVHCEINVSSGVMR